MRERREEEMEEKNKRKFDFWLKMDGGGGERRARLPQTNKSDQDNKVWFSSALIHNGKTLFYK
mgnify:FL=1|jgi:hypothetical protein